MNTCPPPSQKAMSLHHALPPSRALQPKRQLHHVTTPAHVPTQTTSHNYYNGAQVLGCRYLCYSGRDNCSPHIPPSSTGHALLAQHSVLADRVLCSSRQPKTEPTRGSRHVKPRSRYAYNGKNFRDSTMPPPKNQRFPLTNISWLLDTRKADMKKFNLPVCKGLSNDDVAGARSTAFQEIRPGASFETGYFVQEMLGGLS